MNVVKLKVMCLGCGRGGREQWGRGRPHSENTSTEVRSLPWLAPPPATTITNKNTLQMIEIESYHTPVCLVSTQASLFVVVAMVVVVVVALFGPFLSSPWTL